MKLQEIVENVVRFENPDMKAKRLKKEQQVKDLKSINHADNVKNVDVAIKRNNIKSVK
jgi:hypothetical protein